MTINQIINGVKALLWGFLIWFIFLIFIYPRLLLLVLKLECIWALISLLALFGIWFFISTFVVGLRFPSKKWWYLCIFFQLFMTSILFIWFLKAHALLKFSFSLPIQYLIGNLFLLPFSVGGGYLGNSLRNINKLGKN